MCRVYIAWRACRGRAPLERLASSVMKKIIELILCILHPIAVVLIWINLLIRTDIGLVAKLAWGIASIVPIVPFVYVLTGNDFI
jgi:hypothetical protein